MYKHINEPAYFGRNAFRAKVGLKAIVSDRQKLCLYICLTIIEIAIICTIINNNYFSTPLVDIMTFIMSTLLLLLLNYMTILVIGTPLLTSVVQSNAFRRAGVINRFNEPPRLYSIATKDDIIEYSYHCQGIPLSTFIDKTDAIASALNIVILDIRQGYSINLVVIRAVSGTHQVPDRMDWDDVMLSDNPTEIVLGVSAQGRKVVDLNRTPHIQIGGITGSGKTILLRCALHQLYLHGFEIYLCDYKSLVDFTVLEQACYKCVTTLEHTALVLNEILEEMEWRKALLSEAHCVNISDYNDKHPESPLKRIAIASDEIAFAFQRKGQSSENRALIDSIEASFTILAQQGRFAGISLLLSTQRGDADTIPPQIRSNLTVRICGRASDILSRVTIGSSLAAEIPKSIPGRFVDDEEEFFQGFYYEEE